MIACLIFYHRLSSLCWCIFFRFELLFQVHKVTKGSLDKNVLKTESQAVLQLSIWAKKEQLLTRSLDLDVPYTKQKAVSE